MDRGRTNVVADQCRRAVYTAALAAVLGTVWTLASVRSQEAKSAAAYSSPEPTAAGLIEYDPPALPAPDGPPALDRTDR